MSDVPKDTFAFIRKLNDEQQRAVLCEHNAVVAAGAGSGKTTVLASRFAYLVVEKAYQVTEILTLTFTKKAATEMYQRIYTTLSEIAKTESGILKERAQRATDDFVHAPIYTLDAYSASLVKQAATRYGIPPHFTVDQQRCRELVVEEALPFLIAHRRHPVIEALYYQKQPIPIARDFFADPVFQYSHIDEPPDFMEMVQKQMGSICTAWEKRTRELITALQDIEALLAEEPAADAFRRALNELLTPFTRGDMRFPEAQDIRGYFDSLLALDDHERIPEAQGHPVRAQVGCCLTFLYAFHTINLRAGKRTDPAKELVKAIRDQALDFSSLGVFCMQGGLILSYMSLLQEFQRLVLTKKRREGVLTFADVARLARRILKDHPDIRDHEKASFKAIMIDEFQDNNELQKELLFLLAERLDRKEQRIPQAADLCPGKLFFVGDEKQSIYRFRGADVSVFQRLQHELPGVSLSLRTNYRSVPCLIGSFNALFGGSHFDHQEVQEIGVFVSVFIPSNQGELPGYEAAYTPVCTGQKTDETQRECPEPRITIAILPKTRAEDEETPATDEDDSVPEPTAPDEFLDLHENEACFVAEQIQDLLKRYQPDDIVLLFRAHTHQKCYEKQLRLRNIPYISGGMGGFFTDGPVNDLMAVLRLAAYPGDTEAYGVMLHSPWVALSLGGVIECLAAQEAPFADALLPRLSADDQGQFLQGQGMYQRIRTKATRMSCAELLSDLWYTEGYRYETEWHPKTEMYRVLYDYLFNLAVQADAKGLSLAGFTDRIRALQDGEERLDDQDLDIPLERSGAVRLMTIHKSKGLEFPVVFICGCGNKGKAASNSEGVYWSQEWGISFNPPLPEEWAGDIGAEKTVKRNFFYEQAACEEQQKRTAELRRLLYVAMTRAEQEVYVVGSLSLETPEAGVDFSLHVQQAILAKREKQAVQRQKKGAPLPIAGDRIIDDDTLFGLLLPPVLDQIAESPRFFCLKAIPRYTRSQVFSATHTAPGYTNDPPGLARFLSTLGPYYEKVHVLSTPQVLPNHRTATSSAGSVAPGKALTSYHLSPAYTGPGGADLFEPVDALLDRFATGPADTVDTVTEGKDRFTAADFGTLAHICTEALLKGTEAQIPFSLAGHLTPSEADTLLAVGNALAARFIASPLGTMAGTAVFRKSEYRFRSLSAEGIFIDGTIDLLFETPEVVYVVDFKTDRFENPREHLPQMTWYYHAAGTLRKKPCRIYLYYLRTGHAFSVDSC
ncbi:MAG: UvrD-helicase domain-containing protein [Treponema sp.]|nr:UvrD-helicase domain-containing protein [Treponema sp.]